MIAWADSLGGITYPLLSDFYPHGQVAQLYGVLRKEGFSERAIFVIDRTGTIRYVDVHDFDQQPDNEVLFRVLAEIEHIEVPAPAPAHESQVADANATTRQVTVYCTPWCPDCRRVRQLFKEYQIAYTEIDVTKDRAAAQRLRSWANGNETTPTFEIDGEIIVGYQTAKVLNRLGI